MTRDAQRALEVHTAPSHGVGHEAPPTLAAGTDLLCEGAPRCSSAPLGPRHSRIHFPEPVSEVGLPSAAESSAPLLKGRCGMGKLGKGERHDHLPKRETQKKN